jgi:cytochrome P450
MISFLVASFDGCATLDTQFSEPIIRRRPGSTLPVGPSFLPRLLRGGPFRQDAASFLKQNAEQYGDLVYFETLGVKLLQFNHPELVQEMLVRDAHHHSRGIVMQRARSVLGNGLLTSEEPLHVRQRRLAQPAFHRQRISAYGEVITGYTLKMTDSWTSGSVIDAREEMLLLALRIVGKTLFDTDVEGEVHKIAAAVDSFMGFLPLAFLPFPDLIQRLPIPSMRRIRRGCDGLDELIYRMIRERRADPRDRGDLLSMLLASVDQEATDTEGPARMTDAQVRDECLTVLLAGHETTANALSFALRLLADNPEIQEQLASECRRALDGRAATADDYTNLNFAEQVFAEALRLYPPVWVTARTAKEDYAYRGMTIVRGTLLAAVQFAVHRDPRWWTDPETFDPARFTPAAKATRPRMAYFPFGAGNRQCIGEGLAWMEGVLSLATIVQNWKLKLAPGQTEPLSIAPSISLRPKGAVPLLVERRG